MENQTCCFRNMKASEVICAKCLRLFVQANATAGCCPNCGEPSLGQRDGWLRLATGKSILGALLGGYAGVELTKRWVGYRGFTGDWFALIAPVGIILGRLGCWLHGCCLGRVCAPHWFTFRDAAGVPRWPAVPVEIFFNSVLLLLFLWLRRVGR